jgi:sugar/nucleoside kinase (ribokinase family)
MPRPRFVVADTMDLWIETAREPLMALLKRIDCFVMNESEARELTQQTSLIKAGRMALGWGPKYVVIKKGEHGCLLFGDGHVFSAPAYPLEDIHDPTGAGDCFDGDTLRNAVIYGSVIASFNVESFSLGRLQTLTQHDIAHRYGIFRAMSQFVAG